MKLGNAFTARILLSYAFIKYIDSLNCYETCGKKKNQQFISSEHERFFDDDSFIAVNWKGKLLID